MSLRKLKSPGASARRWVLSLAHTFSWKGWTYLALAGCLAAQALCWLGYLLLLDWRLGKWKPLSHWRWRPWETQWLMGFSQCLPTANCRKNFCGSVLFLRCAGSLGKQSCSEGTNVFQVPCELSVPQHVSLCGCILCRRNWHNSSCFSGNKLTATEERV